MRKLSETEQRVMEAFPDDAEYAGHIFKGTLHGCRDWPKRTSVATIRNLFDRGLIEHASIDFYSCPIRLTEEGKKHIANAPAEARRSRSLQPDVGQLKGGEA